MNKLKKEVENLNNQLVISLSKVKNPEQYKNKWNIIYLFLVSTKE